MKKIKLNTFKVKKAKSVKMPSAKTKFNMQDPKKPKPFFGKVPAKKRKTDY